MLPSLSPQSHPERLCEGLRAGLKPLKKQKADPVAPWWGGETKPGSRRCCLGSPWRGETWHGVQQALGAPKSPRALPALGRGAVLQAGEIGAFLL